MTTATTVTLARDTKGTLYKHANQADLSLGDYKLEYCGRFAIDQTSDEGSDGTAKTQFLPVSSKAIPTAEFSRFKVRADENETFTGDSATAPDPSEWKVKSVTCAGDFKTGTVGKAAGDDTVQTMERQMMDWTLERIANSESDVFSDAKEHQDKE